MYNSNIPTDRELPSTRQLIKSTILAALGAMVILVTIVMPAEYGRDPTSIGNILGLTQKGQIKMSLAAEAAAEQAAIDAATSSGKPIVVEEVAKPAPVVSQTEEPQANAMRTDETIITLQPNEGSEIKVDLKKGEVVKFVWASDAGKANFDMHADSKELKIDYHGYGKGSSTREEGTIEAAFDGYHGWFWRNRSGAPLTITLQTEGPYTQIKRVK